MTYNIFSNTCIMEGKCEHCLVACFYYKKDIRCYYAISP